MTVFAIQLILSWKWFFDYKNSSPEMNINLDNASVSLIVDGTTITTLPLKTYNLVYVNDGGVIEVTVGMARLLAHSIIRRDPSGLEQSLAIYDMVISITEPLIDTILKSSNVTVTHNGHTYEFNDAPLETKIEAAKVITEDAILSIIMDQNVHDNETDRWLYVLSWWGTMLTYPDRVEDIIRNSVFMEASTTMPAR